VSDDFKLSVDWLIKDELDGKAAANARYDEIVWKVRTGYAVFLYGSVGVVAALVNQKAIILAHKTALSAIVLVLGFSVFGALVDYSFVSAKLRVVKYRDRLVELVYLKATVGSLDLAESEELLKCLKNSGERKERVDWGEMVGREVLIVYYAGTGVICTIAICLLV